MSCFKKKRRNRSNKILPYTNIDKITMENICSIDEFNELYNSNNITCYNCKGVFQLKSCMIKGQCTGCDNYFHCGINTCIGHNCKYEINNSIYRNKWCNNCIPNSIIMNIDNKRYKDICLCQVCLDDTKTPSIYKKKI